MIKIAFPLNNMGKKGYENHKPFDIDNIDEFMFECFTQNIFGENRPLLFKRSQNIKEWSFIKNIPSGKEIVFEFECEEKEREKYRKIFIKQGLNIEEIKIPTMLDEILSKLDISERDALNLEAHLSNREELNKLEMLFLGKKFNIEEAKKVLDRREEIDIFKSVESLINKKRDLAIKYSNEGEPLPFIYALLSAYKTMVKIKVLGIKDSNYTQFKSSTYLEFKSILPHPYYVFKNIKLASKINFKSLYDICNFITNCERSIREGVDPKEAIQILIDQILTS